LAKEGFALFPKASPGFGGRSPPKNCLAKFLIMWFVYILKCSDGSFYTGCTSDINRRIIEHNQHKIPYTRTRTPVTLISFFAFTDKYKAFNFEKYLKSGSGISFRNRHLI
jgi:predicted GIY-YIG superfamily endonuclease